MEPHISVVIPVYCSSAEHEAYLAETLASVAAQSCRDLEVVIVDDLSPRDILPIVEAAQGLPPTRIVRNAVNMGHAESRNIGVRQAEGELIAFLDHDDVWLPAKLERQVAALDANPDAAMVFCEIETFGPLAGRLKMNQRIVPERPSFHWFVCHGNYVISATAVLVRKQALVDIGLFDSRYTTSDDFDAWLKILLSAPIVHMREKLARYRLHAANVNYGVDRLNDTLLLMAVYMRYFRAAPLSRKIAILPRLARKFAGRLYYSIWRRRRFRDNAARNR